ncbi:host specificity protein J [Methylomonas sp. CM2]|uniref:host specificity protein J n=1 Tax=Methylomonas sp. CM2 TaxID=3417647 RepID=UPI003CF39565
MTQALALLGGAMGGGGGGSARTPVYKADTVRSRGIVEIVEAWAWGEIAGFPDADPLKCIKLDGTPIKAADGSLNFEGVSFDYRTGTQSQDYIQGSVEDAIGTPVSVGVPVTHSTPVVRTITDPAVDAVRVILTFAGLYRNNPDNGDKTGTTVDLQIEVKPAGGSWVAADLGGRGTIKDKQDGAYQRGYVVNLRAIDADATSFDIRVTRITADPDANTVNAFSWDSYVALTYAKLRRPNVAHCRLTFDTRYFSSIPVRSYDLLGWLCFVPHAAVYNPTARTYTGADWDGTLIRAWTRSPPWVLYTLLVTGGHGLGDHIDPAYQDKWALYQIAQRCDELVSDGNGGTEHRYSIDAQIMEGVPAHDMISQIAGVFDAQALWSGTSVYVTQDAPKSKANLYVPANVRKGQFVYSGSGRQVRYTAAQIQYNDITDQSRLTTEYIEDIDGIERYGYNLRAETMLGCTSRAEAHRRGKRLLVTSRREIDSVSFGPSLAGFNDKPGDVIRVADPLRNSGQRYGGRCSVGCTVSSVVLDAPVTLAAGVTYRLAVIGGAGEVMDSVVTSAAGTHSALTVAPDFDSAPAHEMEFIVYDPDAIGQLYRILQIAESDDPKNGFYTVSAIQYDPDKYAEIDEIGDLEPRPNNPYIAAGVVPPSGLISTEGTFVDLTGIHRYLDVAWSASTDTLLRGYHLLVRYAGATVVDTEIVGLSYRLNNPATGEYEITLAAVNIAGRLSSSISITHTLGEFYAISAVHVTGLAMPSGTTEFTGRTALFSWGTDAASVLGNAVYAAGQGGQTPWFRDFEIRVYTAGGALLRTDYVTENAYAYSYDKNVEDGGPRRTFKVNVRARDFYGNYSNSAELTVSNPESVDFTGVELTPGLGQVFVKFTEPGDPDYENTNVYASQTSGFTPGPANLVGPGVGRLSAFAVAADGAWYVRLQGVDAFGPAATYTAELSVTVAGLDVTAMVDDILADPGRAGDVVVEADRFLVVKPGTTAPQEALFAVGYINGVIKAGLRGDMVVDGTIYGRSLVAGTVTADKLTVAQLSAIVADLGTVTAGTLKTSAGTGWRVEVSDSGLFPIWYGTGSKTAGNGLFYLDSSGNAVFKGQLSGVTGTFSGALSGGTINCGGGQFTVDAGGSAVAKAITVYDPVGNVVFQSAAGGIDYSKVLNKAGDNLLPNPDLSGAVHAGAICPDWAVSTSGSPAWGAFYKDTANGPPWDVTAPFLRAYCDSAGDVVQMISVSRIAIDTAQPITLACWLTRAGGSGTCLLRCYCYDAGGALIDASDVAVDINAVGAWTRLSAVFGPGGTAYRSGTKSVAFGIRVETSGAIDVRAARFTLNIGPTPCATVAPYDPTAITKTNPITGSNRTTYIAAAAIGDAEIDRASVNKLKVVEADIVDLNVTTIKIEDEAVTVPRYGSGDDLVTLTVTLPIGTSVNLIATCQATVWDLDGSQTLYINLDSSSGTQIAKNKFESYAGGRFSATIVVSAQYVTTAATTTFVAYANGGTRTKDTTLLLLGTKK